MQGFSRDLGAGHMLPAGCVSGQAVVSRCERQIKHGVAPGLGPNWRVSELEAEGVHGKAEGERMSRRGYGQEGCMAERLSRGRGPEGVSWLWVDCRTLMGMENTIAVLPGQLEVCVIYPLR